MGIFLLENKHVLAALSTKELRHCKRFVRLQHFDSPYFPMLARRSKHFWCAQLQLPPEPVSFVLHEEKLGLAPHDSTPSTCDKYVALSSKPLHSFFCIACLFLDQVREVALSTIIAVEMHRHEDTL